MQNNNAKLATVTCSLYSDEYLLKNPLELYTTCKFNNIQEILREKSLLSTHLPVGLKGGPEESRVEERFCRRSAAVVAVTINGEPEFNQEKGVKTSMLLCHSSKVQLKVANLVIYWQGSNQQCRRIIMLQ